MRLHHIGKVVDDLMEEKKYYLDTFGLKGSDQILMDPIQQVELLFIESGGPHLPSIELLKPINARSPIYQFLKKGGGYHHLCFEVDNLNEEMKRFKTQGALILGKPVPSVGHEGKLTLWIYTAKRELVELVEAG